ncbi:alcohol dehydrogenase [Caenorhabditis elegans]|uniref:alcohol dehydrogenase n=1 Tax=Caenorhabditis elegans TaxID=6239 RepID=Q9UAT1_CAEEL|nr:Enoyl reductase (ER) domain-containing protein [Caenorhabditis elegans]CCD68476.2 Enoyl reductase (ER) domain-containing protein [Caenorhabditis elegans]|eukprot:NP_001317740.1 Uncharacterized protein CELE_D2063.1 [Caenorhabditis elegans]
MVSSDVPKTQRALIFESYGGPLEIKQLPIPQPNEDELLVKMEYSGICHSDVHTWLGDFHYVSKCPMIGGHEGAGSVISVGSKVKNWQIGDKVGIKLVQGNCLNCEYCQTGHEPLCPHVWNIGVQKYGTFQEYATIRDVDAIKIPKSMNMAAAAPVLCGGVTAYKALKESEVKSGQIVAVTGAGGGLGSFAIQYARAMGMRVVAIDHPSKEAHCKSLGAEWFVDAFGTEDIVAHIREITDGGAHGVVNFAAAKVPMEKALEYVRKRGTVVFVGLAKDSKILVDTIPLIFNAVKIKGSIVGSRLDVNEAMDFVARGAVNVPLELVKLEDVAEVYTKMHDGKINSRVVVDFSL